MAPLVLVKDRAGVPLILNLLEVERIRQDAPLQDGTPVLAFKMAGGEIKVRGMVEDFAAELRVLSLIDVSKVNAPATPPEAPVAPPSE